MAKIIDNPIMADLKQSKMTVTTLIEKLITFMQKSKG